MAKKKNLFTSENQPPNRGRAKNIFGPLQKESNLSNDDVKKVFKNFLSSKPDDISKVIEKYPTVFTVATANMLAQEMKGELTGKMELVKVKKIDREGKEIVVDEMRPERRRSYEMVKYMIDRCFGKPIQTDIIISPDIAQDLEIRVASIFSEAFEEPIEPIIIKPQLEYFEQEEQDE